MLINIPIDLTYVEIRGGKCWGNDVFVVNPIVAFEHDKSASKHGLSVELEHIGFAPFLAHRTRRGKPEELGVGDIQERFRAEPVNENLSCTCIL